MISLLAPLALTASTGALLALPLAPALRELISKRDAGPLVTRKDDGKIENFAASLRRHCETVASEAVAGGPVLLVEGSGSWKGSKRIDRLVVCTRSVELPDGFESSNDFYAKRDLQTGSRNIFRTLLSDRDLELGADSQVLRWAHAEANLIAGHGCVLFGRASAGESLTLSSGCKFERLRAPVIYTSLNAAGIDARIEAAASSRLAPVDRGRTRIHGRARLFAGEQHYGDLISTKGLQVDPNVCVFGSVKANGDVHLSNDVEVNGSLVSTRRIHIEQGCYVKGPIISEREIMIAAGVQVGTLARPTTISAPRIRIAPGSVLHGTVWARVEGRVGD